MSQLSSALRSTRCSVVLAVSLMTSGASALALLGARDAAWQPLVTLYGRGDERAAVAELHRFADAADRVLHHRKIDPQTQSFIDGVLSDLTDFDLGELVARLPVERAGYRELHVRGDLTASAYLIGQAQAEEAFAVGVRGPRDALGALSLTVRAKRLWTVNERKAYSFGGRFGLGIGDVRWDTATRAAEEAVRLVATGKLVSSGPEVMSTAAARQDAQRAHPLLQHEDLDVLGIAYDAFPALAGFLSKFGTVQDVRTTWSDRGYQRIDIALRGLPKQYAREFPLVSGYASGLKDLVRARGRWVDSQGRTLATGTVDSQALTATVTCYVEDGRLLPFRGTHVFDDQPIDPLGSALAHSKFIGSANLSMFGITVRLSELEVDASYAPHAGWAEFGAAFTKVPHVEVRGAALGFIPSELVDAFIPGSMAGLTTEFLATAASAHQGRGATATARVGIARAASQRGTVEVEGEGVALDNGLIRMGVAMVNERLLPTPALLRELEQIAAGVHGSFVQDLERFEQRTR